MRIPWLLGCCGLWFAGLVYAQEHPEHPKKGPEHAAKKTAKPAPIEGEVTGENICLGCALKKETGAATQCDKFGHRHALRVISTSLKGEDIDLKGWVLHYLDTDHAQPYLKGKHGGKVTVKGKIYQAERVIEVAGKAPAEKPDQPKKPEHPEHPEPPQPK